MVLALSLFPFLFSCRVILFLSPYPYYGTKRASSNDEYKETEGNGEQESQTSSTLVDPSFLSRQATDVSFLINYLSCLLFLANHAVNFHKSEIATMKIERANKGDRKRIDR